MSQDLQKSGSWIYRLVGQWKKSSITREKSRKDVNLANERKSKKNKTLVEK